MLELAVMKYHRCNACQRFAPLVQPVCDCGARFDGTELQYKACPACGLILSLHRLRCDCGYLFIFRSFLDRQATPQDISGRLDAAYEMGRRAALDEFEAERRHRSGGEMRS